MKKGEVVVTKERFLEVMKCNTNVRTLNWEFGYFIGTLGNWYEDGLIRKKNKIEGKRPGDGLMGEAHGFPVSSGEPNVFQRDYDVHSFFHFDEGFYNIPVNFWYCPRFEHEVLEEYETKQKIRGTDGIVKIRGYNHMSMPQFLKFPVRNRKDWEKLKEERLQLNLKERLPKDWEDEKRRIKEMTCPICFMSDPVGYFGILRELFGENIYTNYYDDPQLVKDILEYLTNFWISLAEETMVGFEIDVVMFWEDMAYKTSPLVGENIFREFMLPYYKRLIYFFRNKGIKHFIVDSDGCVEKLIPLFIEAGVTGLMPFERNANEDILRLKKQYPKFQFIGGINKVSLSKGKKFIDKELEEVKELLKYGGFIPTCDHGVPPDVSWENYKYFRYQLKKIIEKT